MILLITDWLVDFCADANVEVATHGVQAAEIEQLEQELGIPLSASHRACLQIWDGAADFGSLQIYSLAEIRDAIRDYGFQAGSSEAGGAEYSYIYRAKPLALLPFAQPSLSADLFCFDTRTFQEQEYPVVEYDHEVGKVKIRHPSFAAFLQERAFSLTDDLEYFLTDSEDYQTAEQLCDEWANRLG